MGSLYWQSNDCWPVTSWSGYDYYGNWKALQYYAVRFYAPVLVSPVIKDDSLKVFIISDLKEAGDYELKVKMLDFCGGISFEETSPVSVVPGAARVCYSRSLKELLSGPDTSRVFLQASLTRGNEKVSSNQLFFAGPKNLRLTRPDIQATLSPEDERVVVSLKSDVLAKNVYLQSHRICGHFEDNFFNLLPGKPKKVLFIPEGKTELEVFRNGFSIRSLADAFNHEPVNFPREPVRFEP